MDTPTSIVLDNKRPLYHCKMYPTCPYHPELPGLGSKRGPKEMPDIELDYHMYTHVWWIIYHGSNCCYVHWLFVSSKALCYILFDVYPTFILPLPVADGTNGGYFE